MFAVFGEALDKTEESKAKKKKKIIAEKMVTKFSISAIFVVVLVSAHCTSAQEINDKGTCYYGLEIFLSEIAVLREPFL